jgi:hypothetical protein
VRQKKGMNSSTKKGGEVEGKRMRRREGRGEE